MSIPSLFGLSSAHQEDCFYAFLPKNLIFEPTSFCRYLLTPHALELNELTPGLREKLPSTDVRLRPDMRLLEDGYAEKVRLYSQSISSSKFCDMFCTQPS